MRGKTKPGLKIRDFLVDFLKSNFTPWESTILDFFDTIFPFILPKKFPQLMIRRENNPSWIRLRMRSPEGLEWSRVEEMFNGKPVLELIGHIPLFRRFGTGSRVGLPELI
jgi:hypothetical protein